MEDATGPVQALVSEVVSNEGQLAPVLRAVFENENGDIRPAEFVDALAGYSKRTYSAVHVGVGAVSGAQGGCERCKSGL